MNDGEIVDEELKAELREPGSDRRFGVNVVAYPNAAVVEAIWKVQREIRLKDPRQYFYPAPNLHLTVIELAFGGTEDEAAELFSKATALMAPAAANLPAPRLARAIVRADRKACTLSFTSVDGLEELRDALTDRLTAAGLIVEPRYRAPTAHVTFLRYLEPLREPYERWTQIAGRWPVSSTIAWTVSELWMTGGATWYGFPSRVRKSGPYILRGPA